MLATLLCFVYLACVQLGIEHVLLESRPAFGVDLEGLVGVIHLTYHNVEVIVRVLYIKALHFVEFDVVL